MRGSSKWRGLRLSPGWRGPHFSTARHRIRSVIGIAALPLALWSLVSGRTGAYAAQWEGSAELLGQVRDVDIGTRAESPTNLYGALAADRIHHDTGGETYFRAERDWSRANTDADFYLGRAELGLRGLQFSLGRQAIETAGVGFWVADAGRLTFDRGVGWAVSVFGGQPRYFEPQPRLGSLSRDEQFFGASTHYRIGRSGIVGFSFVQLEREAHRIRQLSQLRFRHQFVGLRIRPDLYWLASYDTAERNVERLNAGASFLLHPRLFARMEAAYYKPEQRSAPALRLSQLERYADPIFSLFSASSLRQVRGGLQYYHGRHWSAYADAGLQQYEPRPGATETGYLASVGLLWLPGGDGLERVRAEYSLIDGPGGRGHHWRVYHENRVYERFVFRTKLEAATFDKVTNRSDTATSGRLGIGYLLRPNLLAEFHLEANHNPRFDHEFRVGLYLAYRWRYLPEEGWGGVFPEMERLRGGWAG